jgi:hypothetical protein
MKNIRGRLEANRERKMNERVRLGGAAASDSVVLKPSVTSTTSVSFTTSAPASPGRSKPATRKIENAVYAHIQALRALGHDTVNTFVIARAINISAGRVAEAVRALQARGVKVLK